SMPQGKVLSRVSTPEDVKRLTQKEQIELASAIRKALIASVTQTGGHLGASLGTVELAIALHYGFNSPKDKIVRDAGHLAYAHEMMTGRKDRFGTLRK